MDEPDTPSEAIPETPAARRGSSESLSSALNEAGKIFHYHPHPRTRAVMEGTLPPPVKVADQYPRRSKMDRFNAMLGLRITNAVGTMACAYVFCVIALVSLPSAIKSASVIVIISWIAQTFLQLVLLSIIMVGQNVQAQASDARAENTYKDAEAVLHEALQIQQHLESQDVLIAKLLNHLETLQQQVIAQK